MTQMKYYTYCSFSFSAICILFLNKISVVQWRSVHAKNVSRVNPSNALKNEK
jgi:hypothetical protein